MKLVKDNSRVRSNFKKALKITGTTILIFSCLVCATTVGVSAYNAHDTEKEELKELITSLTKQVETLTAEVDKNNTLQENQMKINNLLFNKSCCTDTYDENSKVNNNTDDSNYYEGSSGKWNVGEYVTIPNLPTDMKLCTDYRAYNLVGTPHYRLRNSCYTDEYGMRRFNNDYVVALGSYYSTHIGDRFEVVFDTGNTITVIFGDGKADRDTDTMNMYTPCINYNGENCANVLEFIIDSDIFYPEAYRYGSASYYEHLKGGIVSMKYLGRDTSADWDTYF